MSTNYLELHKIMLKSEIASFIPDAQKSVAFRDWERWQPIAENGASISFLCDFQCQIVPCLASSILNESIELSAHLTTSGMRRSYVSFGNLGQSTLNCYPKRTFESKKLNHTSRNPMWKTCATCIKFPIFAYPC